jgi:uncharacterized phage-associated protein
MFVAQHMFFANAIVKLVDIYVKCFVHELIIRGIFQDFKGFGENTDY